VRERLMLLGPLLSAPLHTHSLSPSLPPSLPPSLKEDAVLKVTVPFSVGTRRWTATYYAAPMFLSSRRTFAPYLLVIVLSLLVAGVAVGVCGQKRRRLMRNRARAT
jgi:hypothetical protein